MHIDKFRIAFLSTFQVGNVTGRVLAGDDIQPAVTVFFFLWFGGFLWRSGRQHTFFFFVLLTRPKWLRA